MDLQDAADREMFDIALEFAGAQEEAQFHCLALLAGAAARVGRDALGHQLDADPCRQAAVGAVEQAAGANLQARVDLFFIEVQDVVDEDHVPGMGQQFGEGQSIMGHLR